MWKTKYMNKKRRKKNTTKKKWQCHIWNETKAEEDKKNANGKQEKLQPEMRGWSTWSLTLDVSGPLSFPSHILHRIIVSLCLATFSLSLSLPLLILLNSIEQHFEHFRYQQYWRIERRIICADRYAVECYCSIHIERSRTHYVTLHKQRHRNVEISFSSCWHCLNVHKVVVCLCDTITNESI